MVTESPKALSTPLLPSSPTYPLDLSDSLEDVVRLGKNLELVKETAGALSIQEVIALESSRWQPIHSQSLQIAYTRTPIWIRLSLLNKGHEAAKRILEVRSPLIDFLDVYSIDQKAVMGEYHVGDQRPIADRPILDRNFAFPLELPSGEHREILIHLALRDGVFDIAPVLLWKESAFTVAKDKETLLLGAYFGAIAALALYNLFLALSSRDGTFLRYAVCLGAFALWYFGYRGMGYLYLWSQYPILNNLLGIVLPSLVVVLASLFITRYLETPTRTPSLHRLITFITLTLLIGPCVMVADILGAKVPTDSAFFLFVIQLFLLSMSYAFAGVTTFLQGFKPAGFFLVAWLSVVIGVWVYLLSTFGEGLIPVTLWTENAIAIGTAIEFLLLALGLGYRYKLMKDQYALLEQEAYRGRFRQSFLDTVAHELRTPLTVIRSATENLMLLGNSIGKREGRYQKILRATDRMSELIHGYFDDLDVGILRDENWFQSCNLTVLLEEAWAASSLFQKGHRLEWRTDLKEPFVCDPQLTALALRNLTDNALKYSPQGSCIIFRGGRDLDNEVWFAIENERSGLTPEQLEKIFESGYRVSLDTPGSGYGLTLARDLIERQGGTLTASLLDGGACSFRIRFPGNLIPSQSDFFKGSRKQ